MKSPKFKMKKLTEAVSEFALPEAPPAPALSTAHTTAMTNRTSFLNLFSYRHFDNENNICYLDDGADRAIGFGLMFSPLNVAGVDAESQIETIIRSMPPNSIVQFSKLVTPQVEGALNQWANTRLANNTNELLRMITVSRRDFYLNTIENLSMLPDARLHSRMAQYYCTVRIPYTDSINDKAAFNSFLQQIRDLRATVEGGLSALGVGAIQMKELDFKFMLREMLNPHVSPMDRANSINPNIALSQDILMRNTRVTVRKDGRIGFSGKAGDSDMVATCLTVDATPEAVFLPLMGNTLGRVVQRDERISNPYWAYTIVHVLHPDKAKDELTAKFGVLNKQTMSESAWFRSMMGHLYERKDRVQALLRETGKGHTLVRCYTGITLYTSVKDARKETELVKGLYSRAGFRLSEEKHISLPAFVAALPFQYNAEMDPPNKGLQRAWLMSSLNASSMMQIRGEWRGTGFEKGGLLVVSRQGQLASFDLLQTTTNYNFVVVAASGSGKSFVTNDIVADFLSKGGIARIIDVGRSYQRICELMGGENMEFTPDRPISLNPFTGIKTLKDLNELMPMLKDLLRLMAFPLTPEEQTPAVQYQLLEEAISQAWNEKKENTELCDVTKWLDNNNQDMGGKHLALQLKPFADGRYKRWFTGPRTIEFKKSFVVVELEELKQDPALQAVILQLVMYRVTQEMYQMSRDIPKFLAIDEAWDLLGGLKTGKFIETAFRRIRKYNGIAGVITQSFEDFEKSSAAKACIENAEWQFVLNQRSESIEFAADHKRISADEITIELLKSVKTTKGRSEIYIKGGHGSGVYAFVVDKHSYYIYTSNAKEDLVYLNAEIAKGHSLLKAIDILADKAYTNMWGPDYKSKLKYTSMIDLAA